MKLIIALLIVGAAALGGAYQGHRERAVTAELSGGTSGWPCIERPAPGYPVPVAWCWLDRHSLYLAHNP